jgi:hypothetical protein
LPLLDLKLPRGEIHSELEFEELSVAQKFGVTPSQWDDMPVSERVRMIAASRDAAELDYLSSLSEEKARNIRGSGEWVVLDKG